MDTQGIPVDKHKRSGFSTVQHAQFYSITQKAESK